MDEYSNQNLWIEISKPNLVNNIQKFRNLTKLNEPFINVQANALGFGVNPIIRSLVAAGVSGFAVSNLDEAIELRRWGTNKPIILRYPILSKYHQLCKNYTLIIPVFSFNELQDMITSTKINDPLTISLVFGEMGFKNLRLIQQAINFCQEHPSKLNYWGMQYFGKPNSQLIDHKIVKQLQTLKENFGGIYYTKRQKQVNLIGGTSIYGFGENPEIKEVLRLRSRIVHLEKSSSNQWLITVPLGLGNGFSQGFQNFKAIINGKIQAKIFQVTLDRTQLIVDEPFPLGTIVTFWGQEDQAKITLTQAANYLKISPVELTTRLSCQMSRRLITDY